jgi:hypothetical protein
MDEIEIKSWPQFVDIADHLDVSSPGRTAYVYRGQSSSAWKLEPALLRVFHRFRLSEPKALEIERMALDEFKAQAHLHLPPNVFSTTTDTVSWWTLMQHHGAPTRLLDWCFSIYVAAYFAVTAQPDEPGAVWIVHTRTLHSIMSETYEGADFPNSEGEIQNRFLKPDAPPVLVFVSRSTKTHRMIAQQGLFSVCRQVLGHHGEILDAIMPDDPQRELFRKIVIPASLKAVFLRKLRSMNITANALFPGLDGLGRSLEEFIQILGSDPSNQSVQPTRAADGPSG